MGKTRLALELAGRLESQFKQGAVFVPLAQLTSIDELLPAVAAALGIQLSPGGDLQQAVLDHLSARQMLLVLDNFEHLLDEALLINDLLTAAPLVKVLVTSREKLGLEAETVYHLGGLELPPPDSGVMAEAYAAAQLFLKKARQVRPGFDLNPDNALDIIRLCQMVDGSPLGILLAAAWVEHFSPAEIVGQISQSLDFLSRHARDAEPRHASLRAVMAASFNRLPARDQGIFRRLAVFRGGFDLTAAEAVAGASWQSLIALADKSLLARNPDSGRYDLHELLRQYAAEELSSANEREEALAAHARYYLAFVREREARLLSRDQVAAIDEIQANLDNLRQACALAVSQRDFAAVRAVLPGLYAFCDMRSRFLEGEAIFRMASEGLAPREGEAPQPAWALALLSWYDMRAYIEPFESFAKIRAQAQSCLEYARSMHDAQAITASLVLLGAIAEDQSDFENAIGLYAEAMRAYAPLDDAYWVNMRIGLCDQEIHKYGEAIQAFQASLQRGKEMGERAKTGWSLFNLGDTWLRQGNAAQAERMLEQADALFKEIGMPLGVLCSNYSLALVAVQFDQPALARERANIAWELAQAIHSPRWRVRTDELLQQIDPKPLTPARAARSLEPLAETFSPRELEVLQLLKSELNGPEIARRLFVSLNTVRYHTKNIYQKLGVSTRLEAIRRAQELGL